MPPGDLSSEYQRQFAWRSWSLVWDLLPSVGGRTILDLGCGVGDQAAELARRGARVIGVDSNPELLATARSRGIVGETFRTGNLRDLTSLDVSADGIWCSFAAAYFPDFGSVLRSWRACLRPGGWIALTEVDDLFGHEPVQPHTRSMLEAFARDAISAGRYDFRMGRRLCDQLTASGFHVEFATTLPDAELSFQGPAPPDVLDAWRARFARLASLRDFCGSDFDDVADDFLAALLHPQHRSRATVCFCLGSRLTGNS